VLRALLYLVWAGGLALFIGLILWNGAAEVASAMAHASSGLAVVVAYHVAPIFAHTIAWRCLQPRPARRSLGKLLLLRWYGESVGALVPLGQVGGDLLRGRWHARMGVAAPTAIGIAVVDLATEIYAQMAFGGIGLLAFAMVGQAQAALMWRLAATLAVMTLLIFGFYIAQTKGLFTRIVTSIERVFLAESQRSRSAARAMDGTIRRLYRRRRSLGAAFGWHLLGWLLGTGEIWLAAAFIGAPVTVLQALILESLVNMVRGAAFIIPGALGMQEGALIALGAVFGLGPDQSLAISLIKRARELIMGVPGLLSWQLGEFGAAPLRRFGRGRVG
jgi:putative membrane protein